MAARAVFVILIAVTLHPGCGSRQPAQRHWASTTSGTAAGQGLWERCAEHLELAQCGGDPDVMYRTICVRRLGDRYRALPSLSSRRSFLLENGCPSSIAGAVVDYRHAERAPSTYDASHALPPGSSARREMEADRAAQAESQQQLRDRLAAEDWTGFRSITDEFTGQVQHRLQVRFNDRPLEMVAIYATTGARDLTIAIRFFGTREARYDTCHTTLGLADANRLQVSDAEYELRQPDEGGFLETVVVHTPRETARLLSGARHVRFRVCTDVVELPSEVGALAADLVAALEPPSDDAPGQAAAEPGPAAPQPAQ